jgi:hypothetical protein
MCVVDKLTFAAARTIALLIVLLVKSKRRPSSSNFTFGARGHCHIYESFLEPLIISKRNTDTYTMAIPAASYNISVIWPCKLPP